MKAPILFEEAPPTTIGAILGLGIGIVFVIIEYGFHSPIANAVFVVMTSLGVLLVCFWSMRRDLVFWLAPLVVSILYCYLVSVSLLRIRGDMGYEVYPHVVALSLIQFSIMYICGIIIRRGQNEN